MHNTGIFILLLFFGSSAMAADRYINIATPAEHDVIEPGHPLRVSGTGRGMFEGNVVVRIEDIAGKQLVQAPTTMKRDDIAAEGEWKIDITPPDAVPETIKLSAFSPSQKEGDPAITSRSIMLTVRTVTGLEGADWKLGHYRTASGEMTPVLPDTTVTARLEKGKLGGSAGCNRYFGSYTTGANNQLGFSTKVAATMMACAPPVSEQEQQYLGRLSDVVAYQQESPSLQLLDRDGQVVLEYSVVKPLALEDTQWQAAGINNGRGGVVSSATTGLATALFRDGKVSGHTGCNSFSASYVVSGSQISIGPAMSTRMHCAEPDGIMDREQQYLQALTLARVYKLTESGLQLRDEKGSLQVKFVAGNAGL